MLETIIKGGPMMVPLMAESVLAVGILLDRVQAFRSTKGIDTRALRAKVLALLSQDRVEEAGRLCDSTPSPVAAVLLAGLQAYARHRPHTKSVDSLRALVGDAMTDYMHHAMNAVEKRLNWLSFVGNSAPLFGMTGTVTGMIKSFGAIASAGALEGGVVAAGIAEALITTAAGLLIAMLAVIPFHYFTSRVNEIELEALESATELLDFITVRHSQTGE